VFAHAGGAIDGRGCRKQGRASARGAWQELDGGREQVRGNGSSLDGGACARRSLSELLLSVCLALASTLPAAAHPLRLSLDGLDDPGQASAAAPDRPAAPRYVAVEEPPVPAASASDSAAGLAGRRRGEDDRFEFVPTQELPRPVGVVDPGLPSPDEIGGQARLLRGAGATAVAPSIPEHRLGGFGAASAPDGRGADGENAVESAAQELNAAAIESDPESAAPAVGAGAAAPMDLRRLVTVFVVVPLVLAATILLWRLDRGGRRGRRGATERRSTHSRRR